MTFPRIIVSAAINQIAEDQRSRINGNAVRNTLNNTANPAALGPTDMKPVTGVGAPSYTSGVQMWKGATATLKHKAINIKAAESSTRLSCSSEERNDSAIVSRFVLPVAPKIKATP